MLRLHWDISEDWTAFPPKTFWFMFSNEYMFHYLHLNQLGNNRRLRDWV